MLAGGLLLLESLLDQFTVKDFESLMAFYVPGNA